MYPEKEILAKMRAETNPKVSQAVSSKVVSSIQRTNFFPVSKTSAWREAECQERVKQKIETNSTAWHSHG